MGYEVLQVDGFWVRNSCEPTRWTESSMGFHRYGLRQLALIISLTSTHRERTFTPLRWHAMDRATKAYVIFCSR